MFGHNQYYGFTKKFVTVFGTLFNDIRITREYTDGGIQQKEVKVPLTYGSYDKLLARDNSDPDLNRKVAAVSPAMAFIVAQPIFDPTRALQSTLQIKHGPNSQFVGVPYNLPFTLYIYANQEEDGLKVLESILPYFNPAMTVTVKLIPELGYSIDVPIVLNSVDFENHSDGSLTDRRKMVWTLQFTMKIQYSGPMITGRKVIKLVSVSVNDSRIGVQNDVVVETRPGLTANGTPTTSIDDTIPYTEIEATDDFGYITRFLGEDE